MLVAQTTGTYCSIFSPLVLTAIFGTVKGHISGMSEEKQTQEIWFLKQDDMHTNRPGARLSGNNFTRMASNSTDVALAAALLSLGQSQNSFWIVVLTIPVHNIKGAFCRIA